MAGRGGYGGRREDQEGKRVKEGVGRRVVSRYVSPETEVRVVSKMVQRAVFEYALFN